MRKVRIILAWVFLLGITWLFLDFTGTAHAWLGWMAKLQFLPAVLALNVGVIVGLVAITLVLGRIYCSVICPLGILQDVFAWFGKKASQNRYTYSKAKSWLRYVMLLVFVVLMVLGLGGIATLIAPYSAFGRIAQSLLQPLWMWGNNLLAMMAERADSYAYYSVDVWLKSLPVLIIAVVTVVVLFVLAWRGGRTYCNTICPVGTVLGFVSRFSLLKIRIDEDKCIKCGLCAKNCKASCIDFKSMKVDYSRCVDCFDCIGKCKKQAISYSPLAKGKGQKAKGTLTANRSTLTEDKGRREFLTTTAVALGTIALEAQAKKVDGGLAEIEDKQVPQRSTKVVPPGAMSIKNLEDHCTGCQLCVSKCPNDVLRPSTDLMHLMQPEMSFERGYCRPECTACGDVCPTGAIRPITKEEKTAIRIGHAVLVRKNCVAVTTDDGCGLCASKCPTGAVMMTTVEYEGRSVYAPVVDEEKCIGCGTCEHLCPARPFAAIYVEGHEVHSFN